MGTLSCRSKESRGPDPPRHHPMDKPPIQPARPTTRPSPAGPLPARRSQYPGAGIPPFNAEATVSHPIGGPPTPEMTASEPSAEPGEDPFSPGQESSRRRRSAAPPDPLTQPLAIVGGGLVALLTLLVPLASVLADRRPLNLSGSVVAPTLLPLDEPQQPRHPSGSRAPGSSGPDSARKTHSP